MNSLTKTHAATVRATRDLATEALDRNRRLSNLAPLLVLGMLAVLSACATGTGKIQSPEEAQAASDQAGHGWEQQSERPLLSVTSYWLPPLFRSPKADQVTRWWIQLEPNGLGRMEFKADGAEHRLTSSDPAVIQALQALVDLSKSPRCDCGVPQHGVSLSMRIREAWDDFENRPVGIAIVTKVHRKRTLHLPSDSECSRCTLMVDALNSAFAGAWTEHKSR